MASNLSSAGAFNNNPGFYRRAVLKRMMNIDKTALPLRILLVQGNKNDSLLFDRTMKESPVNSEITLLMTAEEALKRVADDVSSFDLIVIDHKLPGMSGLELCADFVEQNVSLPLILLTEPENRNFAVQFHKLGFVNEYLIKDTDRNYLEVLAPVLSEVARNHGEILAREQHRKALEAFENRFRNLLAKNADGVVIVNKNGNVELVNPAAKSLFGRKSREFVGQPFGFPIVPGQIMEIQIDREGMEKVTAEMRVAEIEWEGERACLASLRDITYRKQMEDALATANMGLYQTVQELKKANKKILEQQRAVIEEERLKLLLQMAGTTAHELNQPLMTLLGNIELLGMNENNPEKIKNYIKKIEQAGQRISGIVKKIQTIRPDETSMLSPKSDPAVINLNQKIRILCVEELDDDFERVNTLLGDHSQFSLFRTKSLKEAIQVLEHVQFDLILSEYFLSDGTAMDFLESTQEKGMEVPMVVITGQGDEMIASQVIQSGAFGYIPKSKVNDTSLIRTIINAVEKGRLRREIKEAHKKIAEMSTKDELTGLYNRRYFTGVLRQEVSRARRYGSGLVLCMLDLDHFKQINDTYGHSAGDMVLAGMGKKLRKWTRESDTVCRYGGEEFVVILPNTDAENARVMGERLRQMVASHMFEFNSLRFQVTISMGFADFHKSGACSLRELTDRADNALYQAKEAGRNRVIEFVSPSLSSEPKDKVRQLKARLP